MEHESSQTLLHFGGGWGGQGVILPFLGKGNRTALLIHPVFQSSRIPIAFIHFIPFMFPSVHAGRHFCWHEFSEIFVASHAIHVGSCHQTRESCTELLWVTASLVPLCALCRSQGHCECSLLNKAAYFSYMKNSSFETYLSELYQFLMSFIHFSFNYITY